LGELTQLGWLPKIVLNIGNEWVYEPCIDCLYGEINNIEKNRLNCGGNGSTSFAIEKWRTTAAILIAILMIRCLLR